MIGTVVGINPRKGFIAIRIDDGDVTVAELLGDYDVDLRDRVRGDLEALGGEYFYNLTKQEELDVFVQGTGCSNDNAKLLLAD
tara:strand:- start:429 stop:677 length:249 start_codon:yes stop_codon:yes gene_type:complete